MVWTDQATSTAITARNLFTRFFLQLSDGIINYLGTFFFFLPENWNGKTFIILWWPNAYIVYQRPVEIEISVSYSVVILDINPYWFDCIFIRVLCVDEFNFSCLFHYIFFFTNFQGFSRKLHSSCWLFHYCPDDKQPFVCVTPQIMCPHVSLICLRSKSR